MTIPDSVKDRERDKFVPDNDGNTAVNTVIGGGEVSFSGLKIGMRTTTLLVGDTAKALPLVPLPERNSFMIQNKHLTETLYIDSSNTVTADTVIGTTSGAEILPGGFYAVDFQGAVTIYGVYSTGNSALVKVTEFA